MKKRVILLGIVLMLSISLIACSNSNDQLAEDVDEKDGEIESVESIDLRLAHSQAADHLINESAEKFVNLVKEETNGRINIKIYPAETLGTSAEMADATSTGDVDFYIASTGQYVERYKPISIIESFYIFRDTNHLFNFYKSETFEELKEGFLDETNVHILAPLYYGSRQMTSDDPLYTPEDFSGIKFRVANEAMPIAAIKELGGAPTPVAYNETYLGLQQGVVEAQENPPMSILSMKFYEVQDYLNITDHQYQMMNIFMGNSTKEKISESEFELLIDIANRISEEHNEKAIEEEQEAINELGNYLEIIESDKEAFAEKIKPMYDNFKDDWIDGMLEEIQAIE